MCKKASQFFNFTDDESDTDGEDSNIMKDNLKNFMRNNISNEE